MSRQGQVAKLQVLIVDDHAVVRAGLKALIDTQPDMVVVGEADNGKIAYQLTRRLKPDLIVMDLSMPQMDGVQATEALKRVWPQVKVLVLTIHEDEEYLNLVLSKGASCYMLKKVVAEELTLAIRKIAEGGIYVDAMLTKKLLHKPRPHYARQQGETTFLSERESEVLRLIAWGHSYAEIANQLHLSARTVETYKKRLMTKLGLRNRTDIVRYALKRGWLKDA